MVQHVGRLLQAMTQGKADEHETVEQADAKRNRESIEAAYAAGVLNEAARDKYAAEATAGADVYAYSSAAGWNLWVGYAVDTRTGYRGVRIPLSGQEGEPR